jgi:hypothetical protein
MGGGGSAVFWGGDPNYWANPALLGYEHGVRYDWGRTQLVPGLASDVRFQTNRFEVGYGGIGVSVAGKPVSSLGGIDLDYGSSQSTDEGGNSTGTFDSFEKTRSWGAGISLSQAVSSITALAGHGAPSFTRFADVAFGYTEKEVEIQLAPSSQSGVASARPKDWGVLARIGTSFPPGREDAPLRVDASYGHSVINYNDDAIFTFVNEDQASPPTRTKRDGLAFRAAYALPSSWKGSHGASGWFLEGLDPLISLGWASDDDRNSAGGTSSGRFDVHHWGIEATFANVLSFRTGHYLDRLGDIDGGTWGWGIGIPLGRYGAARYDEATMPQANSSGLPNIHRRGLSVFVDPWAIAQHTRGGHGEVLGSR